MEGSMGSSPPQYLKRTAWSCDLCHFSVNIKELFTESDVIKIGNYLLT